MQGIDSQDVSFTSSHSRTSVACACREPRVYDNPADRKSNGKTKLPTYWGVGSQWHQKENNGLGQCPVEDGPLKRKQLEYYLQCTGGNHVGNSETDLRCSTNRIHVGVDPPAPWPKIPGNPVNDVFPSLDSRWPYGEQPNGAG